MESIVAQYSYPSGPKGQYALEMFATDLRGAIVTTIGMREVSTYVVPGHLEVDLRQLGLGHDGQRRVEITIPAGVFSSGVGCGVMSILVANAMEFEGFRLEKIEFSRQSLTSLPGPKFGVSGVRKLLRRPSGPLFGVALKPNMGMSLEDKACLAERLASCGVDIIKDDEMNLTCPGELVEHAMMIQARLDKHASSSFRPCYVPNISGDTVTTEHVARLQAAGLHGGMLSFLICGWSKVHQVRSVAEQLGLFLYGHRAGYEAICTHVNMSVIAKLGRLAGIDILHVGTPQPENHAMVEDVRQSIVALQAQLGIFKSVLPVFSKTSIELGGWLMDTFGENIVLMACGSIYGEDNLEKATRKWVTQLKAY